VLPRGAGQRLRFLDVRDLARVVRQLLESRPPREAIYNLAQPETVTLRELVEGIARAAGVEPRIVEASWEEIAASGIDPWFSPYAGAWVSWLDPARAGAELGFLGARPAEYLPDAVRWHLDHRPAESHPGYEHRARELELAARLAAATP
jgi:nucleoside-diphosphate-sugar epimerase